MNTIKPTKKLFQGQLERNFGLRALEILPQKTKIEPKSVSKVGLAMFWLPLLAPPGDIVAVELQNKFLKDENKFIFERIASIELKYGSNYNSLKYGRHFDLASNKKLFRTPLIIKKILKKITRK
jgi:hypothetical protein